MAEKEKVRVYNRLFFRLYLNYAVMLLVTAVLIYFIFMRLFSEAIEKQNQEDLEQSAIKISNNIREYVISGKIEDYKVFMQRFEEIVNWDTWVISNPKAITVPMDPEMEIGATYTDFEEVPQLRGYLDILQSAFDGKTDYKKKYDEMYGAQMITYATPVYDKEKAVVGAVFVKQVVDEQPQIVSDSLSAILISCAVALGISFVIVILFATGLSMPISKMRVTALELAAGNYHSKTGIDRYDEIGDLAKTVDILSDKLLENEIERKKLDQMRYDFFANVSHELRTPITVIRAYTETLADGVVQEKEKVDQYYNRMLSECKSMERLVADLLTLSKMQNPDFTIGKEPVNLQQVFDDIMRSAGAIAEKKNITIKVAKDSAISMVLGDYDRLRQMFMVILDNAIKFSYENKTIHINLSKSDTIKVSIKDEGIGIEPSDINYIFEKFYKSNMRNNASGTGLGLAIAKQIAMKHDGNIEVNSTPGVGTEFIFTFPLYEVESDYMTNEEAG